MATYLDLQTTDVNGIPIAPDAAGVTLDNATQSKALQQAPSGDGMIGEITGAKQIELTVRLSGYWDVTQHFDFTDGDPPTIEPSAQNATYNPYDYEINLDPPVIHTASITNLPLTPATPDWMVTVHVRMSHLRDAETKARQILQKARDSGWAKFWKSEMDFDLTRPVYTRLVDTDILGPAGATGSDRLSTTVDFGAPEGTIYFLERVTTPKLLVVWLPPGLQVADTWYNGMPVPLNYHIFYHPSIPFSDHPPGEEAYKWNFDSLNLPHRYLMGKPPGANDPTPDQFAILTAWDTHKNKDMLKQIGTSGRKVIFVYPVGSAAGWLGDIATQKAALLLLQEINHFVQRRAAAELAVQPIGRIGVSGFSFGYNGPARLATSPRVADFDDNWDEIFNFDGKEPGFVDVTLNWFKVNPDKRRLRIYSQADMWGSIAKLPQFSSGTTTARFAATELEAEGGTILHVSPGFWLAAFKSSDGLDPILPVHQTIPALFLHHAMSQ